MEPRHGARPTGRKALTTFFPDTITRMHAHGSVTSGMRVMEDLSGGFGHPSSVDLPRQAKVLLGSIASRWEPGPGLLPLWEKKVTLEANRLAAAVG